MRAVTLRGLLSRKLRTVLTMIAILLGVSMISGTYVLTDTINHSFSQIFQQADRSLDAVISGKRQVQSEFSQPPPVPAGLLSVVLRNPDVSDAEGEVADTAQLFRLNGDQLGGRGAPTLLYSVPKPRFRVLSIIKGHEPSGQEIAIDEGTANKYHLHVGDVLGVSSIQPVHRFRIAGITRFGNVSSIGGASLVSMDLAAAQRMTDKQGKFDQIAVAAKSGITQSELARSVSAHIPASLRGRVQVKTGTENANDQAKQIGNALNFLTIALLAFGGIAVFVGAFIIFNTFSITVAQRMREFALLRTIGATRGQVLRSVILEALLVGVLASLVGLFVGLGIARALNALFVVIGVDLPNAGMVLEARTVIVALIVGTVVTLAAGLWPAVRATRVPPIAALREGAELPRGRFARFTPYIAWGLTILGVALLALGLFASISDTTSRLEIIGFGALVTFIGVAMISPRLVGPLASVVGWPIERATNITGRLARENAMRNPSRTAVTAAALMIGLALVGFVTIFAAELKKTANDAVNREIAGDLIVQASGGTAPMPQGVGGAIARVPGVQTVSSIKLENGRVNGIGTVQFNGVQPATFGRVYRLQWKQGSPATLTGLGPHGALVDNVLASSHHLAVGSTLHVTTTTGSHVTFRVTGIYKQAQFLQDVVIPYATLRTDWQQFRDDVVVITAAPGQNVDALKTRIERALKAEYPVAQVQSQQDLKNQQSKGVNQILYLIYVLLAMSVIVSLFGIVNTLVLSIYERTREIGMLRAIGTTRTQVRWIIRWESVIVAVIGAVLGLLLGVFFAVLITSALSAQGIEFALPIGQLLIWLVFAILFGIVAAAFPARRAARLDVLQAVAYE